MEKKDIPIKDIKIKENIRTKFEEIPELMQSIKSIGLLQPIGVKETKDEYFIIWGHRRFMACKKLGHKTISAIIFSKKEDDLSEEEFYIINASENLHQNPNNLLELGRICRILRMSMSISEISARLNIPKSRVDSALTELSRIPEQFQKRIRLMNSSENKKGDIAFSTARSITKLRGLQRNARNELFEYASKNDSNNETIKTLGALMNNGKTLKESKKILDKYQLVSGRTFYVDKAKYDKITSKELWIDFIIRVLNKECPGLVVKDLDYS